MNRLGKALVDAGVIGDPDLMLQHSLGGGDRMLISVWRHRKDASGVLLDVGVHFADILEYYLGPATVRGCAGRRWGRTASAARR